MTQPRIVAPRVPTPVTPAAGSARLPDDVVDEQVRRVWLFSGVSAFMWSFGMLMDTLVFPATLGVTLPRAALILDTVMVTLTSLETWVTGLQLNTVGGPSWTAIIILASAMIMPHTPRKTRVASLVAAALGPLCVWIAFLRGMDVPSPTVTFLMFLPNFI